MEIQCWQPIRQEMTFCNDIGLFHKAVSQSGAVSCPWANILEEPKKYAYMLVEKLGKKCSSPKEVVNFLRSLDALEIVQAQTKLMKVMVSVYSRL